MEAAGLGMGPAGDADWTVDDGVLDGETRADRLRGGRHG